jgi:hypothetical protein
MLSSCLDEQGGIMPPENQETVTSLAAERKAKEKPVDELRLSAG